MATWFKFVNSNPEYFFGVEMCTVCKRDVALPFCGPISNGNFEP